MTPKEDADRVSFNTRTIYSLLGILAILISFIVWGANVSAQTEQNSSLIDHHEQEIEALKSQLNELKLQLSVIQEQNAQMKLTLNEVRADVATIKSELK